MASAPMDGNQLPLLFKDLAPLSTVDHAKFKLRQADNVNFIRDQHAIPLTAEEFGSAQRYFPIVFSAGENPVPLALMGLNEGVNVFVGDDGKFVQEIYVPAYVRRYPFLLARLQPGSDELSLCFDPSVDTVGAFKDGEPLFADGQPTELTRGILGFCEQFEQAGQRTGAFVKELQDHQLLIDGEVAIQPDGSDKPYIYRGFQMVAEEKLRELRGDVLRKMNQSGLLALVYAHLFSLQIMREIFARQLALGKVPEQPVEA